MDSRQLGLWGHGDLTIKAPTKRYETIAERFEAFHKANPHVYTALVNLCRRTRRAGASRWSAKAAFEVLRWSYLLHTKGGEFKLNNNYTSRYARKLMGECPEFDGFFRVREIKTR